MNLQLNNKKILITGASRGIGLSTAKCFLKEKAKTFLVSRGSNALFENEKLLQQKYGLDNVIAKKCDCANIESLKKLQIDIKNQWGGLDIVVVNAGDGRSVPDALPNDNQWKNTWDKNFESALQTARTFLPMLEESRGVLLFVSSIAGLEAFGAPTDYSTAKTAIVALAKNMSRKLGTKIRVNVVAPGNVYFKGGYLDEKIKKDKKRVEEIIERNVPMKRFASPKEIAESIVFLCSNRASFITGSVLVVDGGHTVGIA